MANLRRISQGWYARYIIPRSRWADFGGKREVVRTLQTRDLVEARSRRLKAMEAIEAELNADLLARKLPPLSGDWLPTWDRAIRFRQEIEAASVEDHPDVEGMSPRADLINEAIEAAEEVERVSGPEASRAFFRTATGEGIPLRVAVDRWQADRRGTVKETTILSDGQAIGLLSDFIRWRFRLVVADPLTERTLDNFTRGLAGELIEWTQRPEDAGTERHPATIQRLISSLSALWSWARRRGLTEAQPWSDQGRGLKKKAAQRAEESVRPYTASELVRLLDADPNANRKWLYGPAVWDLLRLGLLTGARLNEICSLERRDVSEDASVIRIRDGKTANARREVPVHPLIRPILYARVAALPKADPSPSDPLFPELPPGGASKKRSHHASVRFTKFRVEVLGADPTVDYHSLRRSFLDATARAHANGSMAANPIVEAAIVGHAPPTLAASRYAGPTDMETKRRAIEDILRLGLPPEVLAAIEHTSSNRPVTNRREHSWPYADPRNKRHAAVAKEGKPRLGRR